MVVLSYSSLVTVILTVWGAVALAKEPIRDNERSAADYTQKNCLARPSLPRRSEPGRGFGFPVARLVHSPNHRNAGENPNGLTTAVPLAIIVSTASTGCSLSSTNRRPIPRAGRLTGMIDESFEERVVSSRGRARPGGVRQKMSGYPLRKRGPVFQETRP